ncbi:MAG: ribosomal protein L11 [uncultured bacterium]|nr:MAG: ribosomal protein L11 [uncultured bacterium]
MANKKIKTIVKINLPAGEATPAQPLGPALGQHGVAIMDFVRAYNDKTSSMKGNIVPAVITIYEDKSFDFEIKLAPVADMIKKRLAIQKGSGVPNRDFVGSLSTSQVEEIAKEKMRDLNTDTVEAAMRIVEGTARSMGVKIENGKN